MCLLFQVMIIITGAHKALALHKAIEEGVSHMWTVSAFQVVCCFRSFIKPKNKH